MGVAIFQNCFKREDDDTIIHFIVFWMPPIFGINSPKRSTAAAGWYLTQLSTMIYVPFFACMAGTGITQQARRKRFPRLDSTKNFWGSMGSMGSMMKSPGLFQWFHDSTAINPHQQQLSSDFMVCSCPAWRLQGSSWFHSPQCTWPQLSRKVALQWKDQSGIFCLSLIPSWYQKYQKHRNMWKVRNMWKSLMLSGGMGAWRITNHKDRPAATSLVDSSEMSL